MDPMLGGDLPGNVHRLSDLAIVMREKEIVAPAVNRERLTEVLHAHGGTLDVPARAPRSPGGLPRWLTRLRPLPQHKIDRILLVRIRRAVAALVGATWLT